MSGLLSRVLVVGLPGSGKSTFIAALWHLIQAEEVTTTLRLLELHGNRTHLNKLGSNWLACRLLDRTAIAGEELVEMRLVSPQGDCKADLVLPDYAGESFRLQFSERQWDRSYDALVSASTGALIFVHPNEIEEPTRISDIDYICGGIEDSTASPSPGAETISTGLEAEHAQSSLPWDPEHAPTQVQLVDLLQMILSRADLSRPYRVGVVVSAWDLLDGAEPTAWLSQRLPLLHQFLSTNPNRLTWQVFGVSAQGGDLEKDHDRLLRAVPSERVRVEGPGCLPHDITGPVKWVVLG